MAVVQKTWATLLEYGLGVLGLEGRKSAVELSDGGLTVAGMLLSLANEGLLEICERAELQRTSWTNAALGALTLVGNTAVLPIDLIRIDEKGGVKWDGDDLVKVSLEALNLEDPDWRTRSGDPGQWCSDGVNLILDYVPTGTTTGKLVVYGLGQVGELAVGETTANTPLIYLPAGSQMLPIYYALAEYPADPGEALQVARAATSRAKWETGIARLAQAVRVRRDFGFEM